MEIKVLIKCGKIEAIVANDTSISHYVLRKGVLRFLLITFDLTCSNSEPCSVEVGVAGEAVERVGSNEVRSFKSFTCEVTCVCVCVCVHGMCEMGQ